MVALLALQVASCSGGTSSPRALVWARSADSTTLDPAEIEWGEDAKVIQSLFETLVTYKAASVELEPKLAERWTVSSDGKKITFDLRRGIVFHDGSPFDSEAVVFTFERFLRPGHPQQPRICPYASTFSDIDRVEAEGPQRVTFTLKRPSVVMLYNLTLFAAHIVSPKAVKALGDRFAVNPVGTGPYKLARWDRDVRIVLDRNDSYWGPKPDVERVILIPVKSPQTAVEKLRKGEVQVVDHPTLADVQALEADPGIRAETQIPITVAYLGFNLNVRPYNDPRFRQAVSLALDRAALNDLAYHGLAEPASNLVPPGLWKNACPTPPYEYNPEKGRRLLAELKLDPPQVELIHMTFSRPYMPEPLRVAEFVKDQLRKIGLEVKLTGYDKAAYDQKYKEAGHPLYLLGWIADIPDPDNFYYPLLHGDSKDSMNASFFDDPVFNAAVKGAETELDPRQRAALLARAYARYRKVLPTIPLVHVKQVMGVSKQVVYPMHPIEYRFYTASWAK